jgi:hypothetical protein
MRLELIRNTAVAGILVFGACAIRADDQKTGAKDDQKIAANKEANPDAIVLADFQERVKKYVELHKDAAKDAPEMKETRDPAKIRESQLALAKKIAAARKDARPGDIFTPEIRTRFRRLMYPELKGAEGRETKEQIKEDKPAKPVPYKVNAAYPEGEPLPTMPANLLQNLPQLPEELEYRIVGKTLILRDVKANIIVDFVPNAIQ